MTEEPQPSVPVGGVDLANPVQRILRDFATQLAVNGGLAVVAVAISANGKISSTAHVPGGIVQALGLLAIAQQQLIANMMSRPPTPGKAV